MKFLSVFGSTRSNSFMSRENLKEKSIDRLWLFLWEMWFKIYYCLPVSYRSNWVWPDEVNTAEEDFVEDVSMDAGRGLQGATVNL